GNEKAIPGTTQRWAEAKTNRASCHGLAISLADCELVRCSRDPPGSTARLCANLTIGDYTSSEVSEVVESRFRGPVGKISSIRRTAFLLPAILARVRQIALN